MHKIWRTAAALAIAFGVQVAAADAATLHVDAKSNIFGAGKPTPPGGGVLPPSVSVSGGGTSISFSRVTGGVACRNSALNGPDGAGCAGGSTDISSSGGIAGIVDGQRTLFLVGLFLTSAQPADPAPARLDFSDSALGHEFGSLSPKIGQTFFIGDGQTKAGAVQRFLVPAGARRFFLGFADAFAFHGSPGAYGDNVGSVTATFSASAEPPPPVVGKSVVADVVSGTVFIKLPAGKRIRRARGGKSSVATASRFRRYKGKANIPIGSTVDTRRGRIAITSAADLKGATQAADFYDGIFQIRQLRSAHPVTDAVLTNSTRTCRPGRASASAGKRVLGRLWATGKGRFRTRGRYSAASVRGTTWLTEDRCDGTLTKVAKGTVAVRDRILRRTVLVSAGQSYLARAQRASTKA